MIAFLLGIIIIFSSLTIFTSNSHLEISAVEPTPTKVATNNFTMDLKSKINNLISNAINDTDNILNSSLLTNGSNLNFSLLTNGSNLTSSNIVISNNKVISTVNSNDSDGSSSSIIKDQVKTINGVCTSTKVGGNSNDTLASSGNCNDELTGGAGADKFMCGGGNDIVKDYNSKEGDILLDKQNCEKIQ